MFDFVEFRQDSEHHRIQGRDLHAKCEVEGLGVLAQGMHEQSTHADGLVRAKHAAGGILEQGATEALPLQAQVDGQSAKDDHRNGVRHVAAKPARGGGRRDSTGASAW